MLCEDAAVRGYAFGVWAEAARRRSALCSIALASASDIESSGEGVEGDTKGFPSFDVEGDSGTRWSATATATVAAALLGPPVATTPSVGLRRENREVDERREALEPGLSGEGWPVARWRGRESVNCEGDGGRGEIGSVAACSAESLGGLTIGVSWEGKALEGSGSGDSVGSGSGIVGVSASRRGS